MTSKGTLLRHASSLAATAFFPLVVLIVGGCGKSLSSRGNHDVSQGVPDNSRTAQVNLPDPSFELADWTKQSGVDFVHTDGSSGRRYIMETISCGLAIFDYDGDGLNDIYFCNGALLPRNSADPLPHHRLYKNIGDFRFREVTNEAGVACTAFGLGITVGDYDNDGHADMYLSNYGPNVLYRNNGDGTFTDATAATPLGRGDRVGAGTCFLDMDGDGDLDLFAANYVRFSAAAHRTIQHGGRSVYPGPLDYPPETNSLFRNEGDGSWSDVSGSSGIAAKTGTGMGAVCGDVDGDGDTDICVANDEMANFVYRNDGKGVFEEAGVYFGVAFDGTGKAHGNMGIVCDDYDNDGLLDIYVTAYQHEKAILFRNLGRGLFQDVTQLTGAGEGTAPQVTWGCSLSDFDNDGDRDLFLACGHLDDRDENAVYRAPDLVLKNLLAETGQARFVDVSHVSGSGPLLRRSSRGIAVDDLDNDGDLDVVVLNSRDRASVLRNQPQARTAGRHWLQIQLRGTTSNRNGVGAKVRVHAGDLQLVDEVQSGCGYQSHWGTRLHFGLGSRDQVDRLEVTWLSGITDVIENVTVDQLLTIIESGALSRSGRTDSTCRVYRRESANDESE